MALPAVTVLVMFAYVPMTGLVLAFKKFNFADGMYGSPWCWFDNFKYIFLTGKTFWRITRNTVGYYLLFTAVGTVCKVSLAIIINEMVFKKIAKTSHSILIMPTFISAIAVTYVVSALLTYNTGMVNEILETLGMKRINFYLEGEYWPLILTLVTVWQGTGYGSVLYLSTLAGVDQQLYEAVAIDGANNWQRIRYISLPMLKPIVIINLLLSLGNIMESNSCGKIAEFTYSYDLL